MLEIVRGYKQGRAVMFYDLLDPMENKTKEMVPKEEIVKLCGDSQISNAKIQFWQGNAIVRCSNKQLPLVRIDDSNQIIGVAYQSVRGQNRESGEVHRQQTMEIVADISDKGKVVGRVVAKRTKRNTSYDGYSYKHLVEQQENNNSVDYTGLDTIGDIFDKIASDYNLKQTALYKQEFSKKVNMDKKLADTPKHVISAIQSSVAMYLMNMAYDEINETYLKYYVR